VDLSEDLPSKLPCRKTYKLAELTGSYKPKPTREKYGITLRTTHGNVVMCVGTKIALRAKQL
jgi:hypothetical protein